MQPGTTWEIPHPATLTMAELDDIMEATGVDVQAPGATVRPGKVLAAIVVWSRRNAGEILDLDQVYRTLTMESVRFSVDPTLPAPPPG
jgi:hypothetical protein